MSRPIAVSRPFVAHAAALLSAACGLVLGLAPSGCVAVVNADGVAESQANSAPGPSLLLLISVDQMRADYLARFGPSFRGGFRRLLDEGAVYTNAYHGHAITATAPGHAALLSGLHPRDSGIVDNTWYDRVLGRRERASSDPDYRLIGMSVPDDGPGGSPRQFKGTSLVGWLKTHDPRSQAVSISRKDRTAVLTAPEAEHVYWFHPSGAFVTSTYYRDALPRWVAAFNERDWLGRHLGGYWELSRPESAYRGSRADDYDGERGARGFGNVFPHPLPADRQPLGTRIQTTPFMDEATLELGEVAIDALRLGADDAIDVLALGLSSTDAIGHAFGPYSREIHDHMLRLDLLLADFFDHVDGAVGLDRTLIVLTSDHGVVRLPEYSRELGEEAERVRMRDIIGGIDDALADELGGEGWFTNHSYGWLHLDREQAAEIGADSRAVVARAAEYLRSLDSVAALFTRAELLADRQPADELEAFARRSFYADRSGDLYLVHRPYSLWEVGSAANHQSPYPYDRHVPLIVSGAGIASGTFERPVAIIDIAPTLGGFLGLEVPEGLEGARLPGF